VLLVDIQRRYYTESPIIPEQFPDLKQNVMELLKTCREKRIEIVHVRAEYDSEVSLWQSWFYTLNPDRPKTPVTPVPEDWTTEEAGEKVVHKHTFDAFLNTDLDSYLKSKGIKAVFVCGVLTSACVLATTVGAFFRGYKTFLLSDCCGDRSKEKHSSIVSIYNGYYFLETNRSNFLEIYKKFA